MTTTFYIGSGFQNIETVRKLAGTLMHEGLRQTYDWTQNDKTTDEEQLCAIGEAEVRGIKDADIIVILLPGGKGTHTELGIAIAEEKKVFLYAMDNKWSDEERKVTFYYINGVTIIKGEMQRLITAVKETAEGYRLSCQV
ncbi:nucleoside 2-deoxyribosyltransferase [Fictibacillus aquaticus]|uniref:Group-specific protein n=1 Tax=Fictibacillus aquaticus TaxID=2021314 RepID=A0A235FBQ8_9BACL|nr:nucleoside 2-deoxyribosyltransferase [Fictibacillus aquaticus]OYD58662.1 hypothetical protein CGZ90_01810 [Fictibacillus aquaticus]